MKIKPLAGLLLLVIGLLIGSYTAQPAKAQSTGPIWSVEWAQFLQYMSLVHVDDGTGNLVPTVQFTGANVRIVNGIGSTQTKNSTGNLIVGYNEFGNPFGDDRTGSHNISFGEGNTFTSFGGLVGPKFNAVKGEFTTVSGGQRNIANGFFSSVSGGYGNTADDFHSSVSGGIQNTANGYFSSVSGGIGNTADGKGSSVSGGLYNNASGRWSSVSGGESNTTSGNYSSVSGGKSNNASDRWSSVSGGYSNTAGGYLSSVSGGRFRSAVGGYDWAAGGLFQDS